MALSKIGKLICLCNEKNTDNKKMPFVGINREKEFMPTVANTEGIDGSNYKIIKNGRFVFSGMQTGRDGCIRIGLYEGEDALISPAYTTFEVNKDKILPEYFFMIFKSKEMDRYGAFLSDGSIRSNLDWDVFCDIEINIPPIEIQKKYVAIYKGLKNNLKVYQANLDDIKLVCDAYIENLRKEFKLHKIGKYIELQTESNVENSIHLDKVMGVSMDKIIIPTKADSSKNDLSKFTIINKNDFVYNPRNGLAVALYKEDYPSIISWNNTAFHIKSKYKDVLLPDFLFMYLCRKEWNRKCKFLSWGSSTEVFTFDAMGETIIPIPPIEIQQAIVDIHSCYVDRKSIVEKLKQTISNICPILIRGAIKESQDA